VEPSVLAKTGTVATPQLAKDVDYARAVQEAWREETEARTFTSESTPITYKDNEGTPLYGHLVRRIDAQSTTTSVPGIVLFHTAAGPHDLCMHWKADSLVTDVSTFPDGCVVLVADILSDDVGWGWNSDRTKYNEAREWVLSPNDDGICSRFQSRLQAALDALKAIPGVDSSRMAAMAWCLGGLAVVELGRMQAPSMKAMVTFHGVFDGKPPLPPADGSSGKDSSNVCKVLICNGTQDPFVSQDMLDAAVATLQQNSCRVSVLSLDGARHGFTNPAQDFNPHPSFGFNQEAATKSWTFACSLLQRELAASTE